jgi:hypothetical protein
VFLRECKRSYQGAARADSDASVCGYGGGAEARTVWEHELRADREKTSQEQSDNQPIRNRVSIKVQNSLTAEPDKGGAETILGQTF